MSKPENQQQVIHQRDAIINSQNAHISGLEDQLEAVKFDIPMLKVDTEILLVPLVGFLDSVKSQKVMEDILVNIKENEARVVVMDIAGIKAVDSSVAAHLIKIGKAVKLMGCYSVISGISPMIAQNIVNLGVNVADVETTNTLKDAMKLAYTHVGLKLMLAS